MKIARSGPGRTFLLAVALIAAALASYAGVAAAGSAAAKSKVTIVTAGGGTMKPNGFLDITLAFLPGTVTVKSGGTLTFMRGPKDKFPDPHTLTIVKKSELPKTALKADLCFQTGPCTLANGNQPSPANPNGNPFVDVGKAGLDERGDSIAIPPVKGAKFSVKVTAKAGTDLYFMCAIHPWMQGVIHVR